VWEFKRLRRGAKARVAVKEAEGRRWILQSHRVGSREILRVGETVGLIIPHARDRWFKSNPRNQSEMLKAGTQDSGLFFSANYENGVVVFLPLSTYLSLTLEAEPLRWHPLAPTRAGINRAPSLLTVQVITKA